MIPGIAPPLRSLIRRRVGGIAREAGDKLRTVGGLLVALMLAGLVAGPLAARAMFGPGALTSMDSLETWGPTGLFGLWLVQVGLRGGGDVLGFEPAEADQLFAAPLRPEALMRYKLGLLVIAWTSGGLLLAPVAGLYAATLAGGALAALLALPFLQLSAMVAVLVGHGAAVPGWVRSLVLVAFVALPVVLAGGLGNGIEAVAQGVGVAAAHPVGAVLLAPFVAGAGLMTASSVPALAGHAAVLLAVDTALAFALLHLGQRAWVERAQEGADTLRSRLASYRTDGLAGASGWVGVRVPRPPRLGGLGTLLWRRTVEIVRRPATWYGLAGVAGLLLTLGLVVDPRGRSAALALLGAGLVWGVVMLPSVLRQDFRADLDRIDALRAMPVGTFVLYVANVVPMAALLGAFEVAIAVTLTLISPSIAREALGVCVVAPLWALLVVAAENTVFLFLPARMEAGDAALGSVGRNLLSTFIGWGVHGAATGGALAAGVVGWWLSGWVAAILATAAAMGVAIAAVSAVGAWRLRTFVPPLT